MRFKKSDKWQMAFENRYLASSFTRLAYRRTWPTPGTGGRGRLSEVAELADEVELVTWLPPAEPAEELDAAELRSFALQVSDIR